MSSPSSRRGTIMIIVVAVILMMATIAAAFVDNAVNWSKAANQEARLRKAEFAAEAGIHAAWTDLQNSLGAGWDSLLVGQDGLQTTADDGVLQMGATVNISTDTDPPTTYSVRVEDDDDGDANKFHDSNSTVIVRSTGNAEGRVQKKMRSVFTIQTTPGFKLVNAITINGDLAVGGNPEIQGLLANVYANGSLAINGNATIDLMALSAAAVTIVGNPTINGVTLNSAELRTAYESAHSNWPETPIPQVSAAAFLTRANFVKYRLVSSGAHQGYIYTYNPDSVTDAAMTAGTWTDARNSVERKHLGWTYNDSGNEWEMKSDTSYNGVFFAESDVNISGSPGSTEIPWQASILAKGDIIINGKPKVKTSADVLFVTDMDLNIHGSALQTFEGVMLAHEQINVQGNPNLAGAMLAEDAATVSNEVTSNQVSGNVNLTYNGAVQIQEIQPAGGNKTTRFVMMTPE